MADIKLSRTQSEALSWWYQLHRNRTQGYFQGQLTGLRKPTAEALHRLGLIERPGHDDIYGWHAVVTSEGEALAKRLSEEYQAFVDELTTGGANG